MRILILEDDLNERIPWFERRFSLDEIKWATDAQAAIELLKTNDFDLIFLDHDLTEEHYKHIRSDSPAHFAWDSPTWDATKFDADSGFTVAKFLGDNPRNNFYAKVVIHTQNLPQQERMFEVLTSKSERSEAYELQGRNVEIIPFPELKRRLRLNGTI